MIYCVILDLDNTLGVYNNNTFVVRPHATTLIKFLLNSDFKVILWSLGSAAYVTKIISEYFPILEEQAFKIWAKNECQLAKEYYGCCKSSEVVRSLFSKDVVLIAIDDLVYKNMDCHYDYRILIKPFANWNEKDSQLLQVIVKITNFLFKIK